MHQVALEQREGEVSPSTCVSCHHQGAQTGNRSSRSASITNFYGSQQLFTQDLATSALTVIPLANSRGRNGSTLLLCSPSHNQLLLCFHSKAQFLRLLIFNRDKEILRDSPLMAAYPQCNTFISLRQAIFILILMPQRWKRLPKFHPRRRRVVLPLRNLGLCLTRWLFVGSRCSGSTWMEEDLASWGCESCDPHLDVVGSFGLSVHHQETVVQVLLCPPPEEETQEQEED